MAVKEGLQAAELILFTHVVGAHNVLSSTQTKEPLHQLGGRVRCYLAVEPGDANDFQRSLQVTEVQSD